MKISYYLDRLKAQMASNPPSQGLGDTVAKVTKALGVQPCGGCKKRQERLNRMVPYKKP